VIYLIGGARPNFMKIAAISRAFDKYEIFYEIIHTGQHYDYEMDKIFFEEFGLKEPLAHLDVGSGPHGEQTAKVMERFERLCFNERPDMVFTVGDVNSTMAAALVGAKMNIPVAHQEAGMRSGDRTMPEEINRIVTDHISDYLFPIASGDSANLLEEGIDRCKIFLVGDPMIDNLLYYSKEETEIPDSEKHILVEIHRPANVDNKESLEQILKALSELVDFRPIIFPLHPRTKKMIDKFSLWNYLKRVDFCKPMGYFEFLKYMKNSCVVITDSDGIQQETSVLDIPCVSIRNTTNIPYTVKYGTNVLVKPSVVSIVAAATFPLYNERFRSNFPDQLKRLNDGKASERIAEVIRRFICNSRTL
jgi:UDP-N-acetylglucosamine 2-epimerase (non-hydrolysing)